MVALLSLSLYLLQHKDKTVATTSEERDEQGLARTDLQFYGTLVQILRKY